LHTYPTFKDDVVQFPFLLPTKQYLKEVCHYRSLSWWVCIKTMCRHTLGGKFHTVLWYLFF